MGEIAKRRMDQTWRQAVEARLRSAAPSGTEEYLSAFDVLVRSGAGDAEAAYRTLARAGLLWRVEGAGFTASPRPGEGSSGNPHEVPTV